jgi:ankyrin repeat protein
MACEKGDTFKVKELLDVKKHQDLVADINVKGLDDYSPLHHAASEGFHEIVAILIEAKSQIDPLTTSLRTPLHIACYRGNKQIIEMLIKAGANINAQEKEGNTPSHILSELGCQEALTFLLSNKPDLNVKNAFGETIEEVAANLEIKNMVQQYQKNSNANSNENEKTAASYTRTVVENMILHNGRADMVKSLMFKQMLNSQQPGTSGLVQPPSKNEVGKEENKAKQQPTRRYIKIIETAMKIGSLPKLNSPQKTPGDSVCPEDFLPIQMLGKGSFGEVYLVQYKLNGKLYAMKILNKKRVLSQNLLKYAATERNVLCFTKHPFIVGLNFAFQTSEKLFLVLDYCPAYSFISTNLS